MFNRMAFKVPSKEISSSGKPSNIKHVHSYTISDSILDSVNSEKDLGVIFDNTLSFEEHTVSEVKKANSIVGLIRRSFQHIYPQK